MTPALLGVRGLVVHYSSPGGVVRAVDGIDLEIQQRETVALVGESGSGKSTLARAVMGLEDLKAGGIELEGEPIFGTGARKSQRARVQKRLSSKLQMVFQNPDASLNPRMTLASALAEPLRLHRRVERRDLDTAVSELLQKVGIDPSLRNRYPHELSGGQRQRISIARALAVSPKLLVLDEAVSGLDVSIRAQILNLLADLQERLELAYLFITHDLGVARHTAERIYVMYLGQIVEHGRTEEVLRDPKHPYTRALVAAVPSLDPAARHETAPLKGEVPSPVTPPSGCRFHTRCPLAFDRCDKEVPLLFRLEERRVRCFLFDSSKDSETRASSERIR
jgi:oligopeptide/dipeptide ABC transporter ATP-binding protein